MARWDQLCAAILWPNGRVGFGFLVYTISKNALAVRKIAYPDVFEFHVAASAGVQLQCDLAIEGGWLGIGEVHHGHAVQAGSVAVSVDLDQIVVPLAHTNHALILRRWPDHPPSPVLGIDAGGVMHHGAVDLKLHTLGHIRSSGLECTMEEDSAIAITHALEAKRKLKVFVVFFGLQIPIVFREAFAVDQPILDRPALVTY